MVITHLLSILGSFGGAILGSIVVWRLDRWYRETKDRQRKETEEARTRWLVNKRLLPWGSLLSQKIQATIDEDIRRTKEQK